MEKAGVLIALEKVEKAVLFVVSKSGFTKEALNEFERHGISWSGDGRWLTERGI